MPSTASNGLDTECNYQFAERQSAKNYEFVPSNWLSPDPGVSPVFADVRGVPPILVQIGEAGVMLGNAMRFASLLEENRVRFLGCAAKYASRLAYVAAILPEGMQAVKNVTVLLDQATPNSQPH